MTPPPRPVLRSETARSVVNGHPFPRDRPNRDHGDPYADVPPPDHEPAPETDESTPSRRLVLWPASAITPRPVRWAWDTAPHAEPPHHEGRLPVGSLSIAVGRAGVGKSQWAAWMTAKITTGTLPGAYHGRPRSVIYAATEDSWDMTIVPRLIAAGAKLERVYRVSVVDDDDMHARLTLPTDLGQLGQRIREKDVALIVLDPLLSMIAESINDYRAREVRTALEPLVALADHTRATLVGLAHFTKGIGTDPLMLVSGSAAFGQLVRCALAFARDDDADQPTYVMSTIKSNLGREDLPSLAYRIAPYRVDTPEGDAWVSRLEWTGEPAERSVRDLLRGSTLDTDTDADADDIRGWLHTYLTRQGGSATPEDITKAGRAAGYSPDQLKRAKKPKGRYPKVHSRKTGMGDGWVWSLEGGEPPEGSAKGVKRAVPTHVPPSPSSLPSEVSDEGQEQ